MPAIAENAAVRPSASGTRQSRPKATIPDAIQTISIVWKTPVSKTRRIVSNAAFAIRPCRTRGAAAIAANKANSALTASAQPARRPVQKPPCCEGSPNGNSRTGSVPIRNIAWTLLSIASVAKKAATPISIGLAVMRGERAEISKMSKAMEKNAPERSSGLTDRTDIAIPPENAIANVPSSATRQSVTKARSRKANAVT